jgi:hypothetical protein
MGVPRISVLVLMIVWTVGCSGTSTAEDSRRAELLDRDPLLVAEIGGVRWETSPIAGPGSGGPGTYWTQALRWGTIEGDPRLVLLEATKTARRLGWTITRVECFSAATFCVGGWKQFDRFVALLSMGWSRDTDQFSIKAETPPVNAGGTNSPPARSSEVDLTRSCLVTGEDTSFYGGGGPTSGSSPSPDASTPA